MININEFYPLKRDSLMRVPFLWLFFSYGHKMKNLTKSISMFNHDYVYKLHCCPSSKAQTHKSIVCFINALVPFAIV